MLTQVAEGVLIHQSELLQNNAVVVQGWAGVLLIDAGITDSEMVGLGNGQRFRFRIRRGQRLGLDRRGQRNRASAQGIMGPAARDAEQPDANTRPWFVGRRTGPCGIEGVLQDFFRETRIRDE